VNAWQLAWRQARVDARAGELRLLFAAVVLAVAALTAVAFFAARVQGGLERDAAQLLGGDAVVSSDQPTPPAVLARAQALGLATAASVGFPSMARAPDEAGGASRLVALKAVDAAYPLRGQLRIAPGGNVAHGPPAGSVWVDAALLTALDLQPGQALWLGDARLTIAAVLEAEPDRGGGFINFAPRVMLALADLPATGLVQPASRITYRLAVIDPTARGARPAQVRAFTQWVTEQAEQQDWRGLRVESLEGGRPEMRQTLTRAQTFLNLVALLAALLAAVAIALAAQDYARRHLDDCAMLRVLGVRQRTMALAFALLFGGLALAAGAVGALAGWALHHAFAALLALWLPVALAPAPLTPLALGLGVALMLVLGFGLPAVLQLARVPPLRVVRRDLGTLQPASLAAALTGLTAFGALLLVVAGDLKLGGIAVGGFAVALLAFALLAWLLLRALRPLAARAPRATPAVMALRQLTARPGAAVLQTASLAVGLMALALLVLVRTDLMQSWRAAVPADAPNRFVISIQPDQASDFRAMLDGAGVVGYDWFPMIRGRLIAINDQPVATRYASDERARRTVEREFNLSHAAQMPDHNRLVGGAWGAGDAQGLSIEEGVAETLGVQLGDALTFEFAGSPHTTRITSVRRVDWTSLRANFFVMYPLAEMPDAPVTYMTAFHAPADARFDVQLTRRFPNVTAVDVSASLAQMQTVVTQISQAVELLFTFTVAAGVLVLLAAVGATREARAHEYAVMRALGAPRLLLARMQRAELLGLGALAGGLATLAALAVGWLLAREVFGFAWRGVPWAPLVGAVAGALLAWAAGSWSLRGLTRRPVAQTLRRSTAE